MQSTRILHSQLAVSPSTSATSISFETDGRESVTPSPASCMFLEKGTSSPLTRRTSLTASPAALRIKDLCASPEPKMTPTLFARRRFNLSGAESPETVKTHYSYNQANIKLKNKYPEYAIKGALPAQDGINNPWEVTNKNHFLFEKENKYYVAAVKQILRVEKPENEEANQDEFSLAQGDYIYVLFIKDNQKMLRLASNASMPGHQLLTKGFDDIEVIASGEIYFHAGDLILYNHKSQTFRNTAESVTNSMQALLGENAIAKFYDEKDDADIIKATVERRIAEKSIAKIDSLKPLIIHAFVNDVSRPSPTAYRTPTSSLFAPLLGDSPSRSSLQFKGAFSRKI